MKINLKKIKHIIYKNVSYKNFKEKLKLDLLSLKKIKRL